MIENVSTQLTVFHCFAHCLLPGRAFASLYALLFLEKEAKIGGRVCTENFYCRNNQNSAGKTSYVLDLIMVSTVCLPNYLLKFA